jgi:phage gp29-like protein
MLYDQFGKEIPAEAMRAPDRRVLAAVSLRDRWSDYPSNGLTPVKLASYLRLADQGDVRLQGELFEEMEEKDAHLYSMFQTRKLAVISLPWQVDLPEEEAHPRKKEILDFCRDQIGNFPSWEDFLLDLLDAIAKGYSLEELLWDILVTQGRPWWIVRGYNWVHPKNLTWSNGVTPRLLTETDSTGMELAPFKFIFHRYRARSGYDTRAGIMRVCAWMYLFKNYAIKDWAAFAEVFGMPLRLGKFEPGASDDEKRSLINAVSSLGSDAAGIISKNTEIQFVEASRTSTLNIYQALTDFCDAQMSKAVLGQTLTSSSGQGGSGSYALGQVHNEVRRDLMAADARSLARTINDQLLKPLVGFNFGWDAPVPRFKFQYEPPEDLASASTVYQDLVNMGFDVSQEHIAERFKVPIRQPGETSLRLDQRVPGGGGPSAVDSFRPSVPLPGAGTPETIADQANAVQDTALNGAQVTALQGIVQSVANGLLLPDSAIQLILVSFPAITEDQARKIIDPMRQRLRPPASAPATAAAEVRARAEASAGGDAQGAVDRMIDDLVQGAGSDALESLTQPVRELIAGAKSMEEIREGLYKLYPKMNGAKLQDLVTRASFAAEQVGRKEKE